MARVSRLTVIPSSRIWWTNSPTRSLARAVWLSSRAILPFDTIWSSSEPSAAGAAAAPPCAWVSSAIGSSYLSLDLLLALGVGGDVLQERVEIVVAIELAEEIVQALARLEQLPQRLDLLDDG